MKKIVALVLAMVMVLGLATTAMAATAYTPDEMAAGSIAGFAGFDAKLELADKETDEEFAVYTVLMVAKKAFTVNDGEYYDGEYERGDDFDLQTAAGGDEFVIVDGTGDYEYAIVDGKKITYLADAETYNEWDYVETAWETKAKAEVFPVLPLAAADVKCDTFYTTNPAVTEFYWYEDTLYTANDAAGAGDYVFNVDGVAVDVVEVPYVDATTVNGESYIDNSGANDLVIYTSHNYNVASKGSTYIVDATITGVTCDACKASFGFTPYGPVVATKMFGEYGFFAMQYGEDDQGDELFVWVELKASAAADADKDAATDAEGDKVTSAETFDAGIAMYVGMSVMAAAGSAVVLKKKD